MKHATLEELAIYLPYGLKCQYGGYGEPKITVEMMGLSNPDSPYEFEFKTNDGDIDADACIDWVEPILHPLSDLTKEIEVNGEKFVPVDEIKKWDKFFEYEIGSEYGLSVEHDALYFSPMQNAWPIIKMMASWHFDLHGLIDRGAAIDINTLNQNHETDENSNS